MKREFARIHVEVHAYRFCSESSGLIAGGKTYFSEHHIYRFDSAVSNDHIYRF